MNDAKVTDVGSKLPGRRRSAPSSATRTSRYVAFAFGDMTIGVNGGAEGGEPRGQGEARELRLGLARASSTTSQTAPPARRRPGRSRSTAGRRSIAGALLRRRQGVDPGAAADAAHGRHGREREGAVQERDGVGLRRPRRTTRPRSRSSGAWADDLRRPGARVRRRLGGVQRHRRTRPRRGQAVAMRRTSAKTRACRYAADGLPAGVKIPSTLSSRSALRVLDDVDLARVQPEGRAGREGLDRVADVQAALAGEHPHDLVVEVVVPRGASPAGCGRRRASRASSRWPRRRAPGTTVRPSPCPGSIASSRSSSETAPIGACRSHAGPTVATTSSSPCAPARTRVSLPARTSALQPVSIPHASPSRSTAPLPAVTKSRASRSPRLTAGLGSDVEREDVEAELRPCHVGDEPARRHPSSCAEPADDGRADPGAHVRFIPSRRRSPVVGERRGNERHRVHLPGEVAVA